MIHDTWKYFTSSEIDVLNTQPKAKFLKQSFVAFS